MVCVPCAPAGQSNSKDAGEEHNVRSGKKVSFNESRALVAFDMNVGLRAPEQFGIDEIVDLKPVPPLTKTKAPEYTHSERVKGLCKSRELRRAIVKARMLRKEGELNSDTVPELDEPELGHRRGILKNIMADPLAMDSARAS